MIGANAPLVTARVAACVAALALSVQAFAEKTTVEFANGATRPHSVALLPVEATVNRAKVVDTDSLVDDGLKYGSEFNARVKALLEGKGYAVEVVNTDRINSDPQLQEYVVEATRGFKDMMSKYKPKKLESRIYNAGPSAKLLAQKLGVDALVFSTMSVTITGAGKAIVSGLFGGTTSGASSNLEVVNGKTGDLEATFLAIALVTPGDKTDQDLAAYVDTLATRTMNKMPGSDPNSRIDVAQSDDDVLDEAEKTLKR
jgi:hypothetical protein